MQLKLHTEIIIFLDWYNILLRFLLCGVSKEAVINKTNVLQLISY